MYEWRTGRCQLHGTVPYTGSGQRSLPEVMEHFEQNGWEIFSLFYEPGQKNAALGDVHVVARRLKEDV